MPPDLDADNPALNHQLVLVTGATGFIGSRLVERLQAAGAHVRGLVRSTAKATELAARGVEIAVGDLADGESLRRAVRGCSIVFSVAGWTGRPLSLAAARRVNVEGTRSLVQAAIEAGVRRVVHTSSIAAYGLFGDGIVDESWPLRAVDVYGATKAQSETIVRSCAGQIEIAILRPAQVFGPRGGSWTTTLYEAVKRGLPILVGGGIGTFHPCYVGNLADAYCLAAVRPAAAGEAFTIVDGALTWREFASYYGRMAGRCPRSIPAWSVRQIDACVAFAARLLRRPLLVPPGFYSFLAGSLRYSNEKARRLLGWSPRVSIEEGMHRVEAWLRETRRLK